MTRNLGPSIARDFFGFYSTISRSCLGHTVVERSAAPPPLLGKFMDQQMGKAVTQDSEKKSNVAQVTGGES